MKVTIDIFDGNGPLDYSAMIESKHTLEIVRKLNEPSVCEFGLLCTANTIPPLCRNARVAVADDKGWLYFTGYLTAEPALTYLGSGTQGPAYLALVSAISDDILLDRQALSRNGSGTGQAISVLFKNLTSSANPGSINSSGSGGGSIVGSYSSRAGTTWSSNAHALAASARMSYRILDGTLSIAPVGSVVHRMDEGENSVGVGTLTIARPKMLVNDVTLCGEEEPAAYVTEYFQGDGVTSLFTLSERPFTAPGNAEILADSFDGPRIDGDLWHLLDPGSNIGVTSDGLSFNGGSGADGGTYIESTDNLEIGGSILLEATGIVLNAGSDGMLLGLAEGIPAEGNYLAGFRVKASAGAISLVPVVSGVEAGASFALIAGSIYTLRLRVYCAEQQRILQTYRSAGGDGPQQYGGDTVIAGARVGLEVQETINGIPSTAVILFDGSASSVPSYCRVVIASSTNLMGSIRSVMAERRIPAWVGVAAENDIAKTARIDGSAMQGECHIESSGILRFYSGSVPSTGVRISVCYRTHGRAIARCSDPDSISREAASGIPGMSRWVGGLAGPIARSSADCENGAHAMLNMACSRDAAIEGRYVEHMQTNEMDSSDDLWPGDELNLGGAGGDTTAVVVREVRLKVLPVLPQIVSYSVDFANDWAQELSLKLSSTISSDAFIPETANLPVLQSLNALSACITGSTISVDAGVVAPTGGGFEVRRRDCLFGPGVDGDLVLQSAVQHFDFSRVKPGERYYIRMYDGSNPPLYSRVSSALFVNLPM